MNLKNWKKIKLSGVKVFLRAIRKSDAPRIFELINNRKTTFFLESVDAPVTLKQEKEFIVQAEKAWKSKLKFIFAIIDQNTGQSIGCCEVGSYDATNRRASFGIWIGKPYWRHGFGFEAAVLAFQFGFETLKLNRIKYRYNLLNTRSKKLTQKIGTKFEGIERKTTLKRGKFYDSVVTSMLADEWKQKSKKIKKQILNLEK